MTEQKIKQGIKNKVRQNNIYQVYNMFFTFFTRSFLGLPNDLAVLQ